MSDTGDASGMSADALRERLAACESDFDRLRILSAEITEVVRHLRWLRAVRDETAHRLRDSGHVVRRIAKAAGVSDTYITRMSKRITRGDDAS